MTARYLIDTNIASAAIKDGHGPVARHVTALPADAVVTSAIVAGELRFGAAKKTSAALTARVENLLALMPVLPVDEAVSHHYGDIRANLSQAGHVIGQNDLWIAAHARAVGLILVTDNVAEFSRVEGLRIENWLR